jgi:hypothetical protein
MFQKFSLVEIISTKKNLENISQNILGTRGVKKKRVGGAWEEKLSELCWLGLGIGIFQFF